MIITNGQAGIGFLIFLIVAGIICFIMGRRKKINSKEGKKK